MRGVPWNVFTCFLWLDFGARAIGRMADTRRAAGYLRYAGRLLRRPASRSFASVGSFAVSIAFGALSALTHCTIAFGRRFAVYAQFSAVYR